MKIQTHFLLLLLIIGIPVSEAEKTKSISISDFAPSSQAVIRAFTENKIVCTDDYCWNYVPNSMRSYPSGIKRAYINITDVRSDQASRGQVTRAFYAFDCYHGKLGIGEPRDPVYPNSAGEKLFNFICTSKRHL